MSGKADEPSFPLPPEVGLSHFDDPGAYPGLSKREYAAIHLRVPTSGQPWLDEMITDSMRNEFAGKALASVTAPILANIDRPQAGAREMLATECFELADAMLARKGGAK